MAELAYFLGAGASANCIPVVNEMEVDILRLGDLVTAKIKEHQIFFKRESESDPSREDLLKKVREVLLRLSKNCKDHSSIDTYAKKLYLIGDTLKFNELKNDLSFYFTLVQILIPPDKRYDNFWASILQDVKDLPPKVNIISWNYDFQVELTYKNITGRSTISDAAIRLKLSCPNNVDTNNYLAKNFTFFKLNGSARISSGKYKHEYLVEFENDKSEREVLTELFVQFLKPQSTEKVRSHIKFAWENDERKYLLEQMIPMLNKIKVLVIIGYSFPFFNRKIDLELFSQMISLERIYIQDKNPDNIKEILKEFDIGFYGDGSSFINRQYHYHPRINVDQFVFPKELELD